jgi:prophage regulatory protein
MSLEHSPLRQQQDVSLDRVLRWPEVHALTGLSRTTVWREVRAGRFPRPINPTPTTTGWFESQIAGWQEERRANARRK